MSPILAAAGNRLVDGERLSVIETTVQANNRSMTAVVHFEYGKPAASIGVDTRPIPTPGPGYVVVKLTASPINPSDLMYLRGIYGVRRSLPAVPGFEACGTVVDSGPGLPARFWLGRRVACVVQEQDGCWAEYFRAPLLRCLPVPRRLSDEQAATMLINPFTAWALVDTARRVGTKGVVQTAAGSALGRMIRKFGERRGLTVIDVVRRADQADELRREGARCVLVSSDHNFPDALADACRKFDGRMAFDAVAGEMTSTLAEAMPEGSRILVYGALALQDPTVPVQSLIFRKQQVEGFFLGAWFEKHMMRAFLRAWPDVVRSIDGDLSTPIRGRYPLSNAVDAIESYESRMSGGKILLVPD